VSRVRVGVYAALVALALTACGTTVPQQTGPGRGATGGLSAPGTDGLAPSGTSGGELGGTAGTGGIASGAGGGIDAIETSGTGGAGISSGGGVPTSGGSAAPGSAGGAGVTARGLTASTINIGVVTTQDAATLGKSLGAESLVGGDHVAEIDALVKHINARGGIAGRKVVAVFEDVRTADATSDPAASAQTACEGLTEDKQVFAVISIVGQLNNEVMYQCMAKHRTPFFGVDLVPHHASSFARYAPHVYGAHTLVLERLVPTLAKRLQAQSWFSGWDNSGGAPGVAPAKVGILYVDGDNAYLSLAKNAMAEAGHPVADTFGYHSDLSRISSEMQSAVLQFRSNGVTHLLIEESDGVLFFLPAAENQGYRPRYGFTSLNGAKALADTGTVPARQFVGMLGVGWAPALDVGNTKTEISPAAAACRKIMKDAGRDTSDATAFFYMAVECDAFLLLKAGLERQTTFTAPGLRQGLEALGAGFDAAAATGIAWHPGSYDGVSALLDFGYANGTFSYRGSRQPT
jgi:ABC-type branched-subunit amino acid transport system substrate-binding protein